MSTARPQCRGVALTCIDFRFVEPLRRLLEERKLVGDADVIAWPGGALRVGEDADGAVLDTLSLARDLHSPQEVILTVHHDCGWIGGSSQFDSHGDEVAFLEGALDRATSVIERRLPGIRISRVRLELDSSGYGVT